MIPKKSNRKKEYIYLLQIIFAMWVCIGSGDIGPYNIMNWKGLQRIARFITYILTINITEDIIEFAYRAIRTGALEPAHILQQCKTQLVLLAASAAVLLPSGGKVFGEEFLFATVASLLVKYLDGNLERATATDAAATATDAAATATDAAATISYGSGMACSFFEGYLRKVLPPDEASYDGFQGAISNYEDCQHVRFPVKQLFLVIPRSLHCPPSLAYFNKDHQPSRPRLEACKSLDDVTRNVAGVQRRVYRNSAYQIQRRGAPPVYLVVECASPLHTLHQVVTNKALYDELLHADAAEIRSDFCGMLEKILRKSPDCRGKCSLVHYDDTDPEQNLADILLQKIEELEPNFEEVILDTEGR